MSGFDLYNSFHQAEKLLFSKRVVQASFHEHCSFQVGTAVMKEGWKLRQLMVLYALSQALLKCSHILITSLSTFYCFHRKMFSFALREVCPTSLLGDNESSCFDF